MEIKPPFNLEAFIQHLFTLKKDKWQRFLLKTKLFDVQEHIFVYFFWDFSIIINTCASRQTV